jgi:hypothetical protein
MHNIIVEDELVKPFMAKDGQDEFFWTINTTYIYRNK